MSFGTDFDGCLFDMSPIIQEVALKEFGRPILAGIIAGYNLAEIYNLTEDQIKKLILICQEDRYLTPEHFMPGARETLNHLGNSAGYPIIVITSRSRVEPVKEFLRENLDVDPRRILVLHAHSVDKGKCAYSLGLEMFLDDYHESLRAVMDYGIRPLLFNQIWNQQLPRGRAYRNMERITNWQQLRLSLCGA